MKLYNQAPTEIVNQLRSVMTAAHDRLVKHRVTVGVLLVRDDAEEPLPCLKHHGYAAMAIVSITPIKHRAKGSPDAIIEIDQVTWDDLGEAEQNALLDHELTHLELVLNDGGAPKLDGCGRPKLRVRLHDHQYGWFHDIAMRHGEASQEVQQYAALHEERHQQWFAFAGDLQKKAKAKRESQEGLKDEITQAFDDAGILAKPKRGRKKQSFEAECDQLFKDAGIADKVQKNVTIKIGSRRRAAQT
jgi:hypothetical protein